MDNELFDSICLRLADGELLIDLLKEYDLSSMAFFKQLKQDAKKQELYDDAVEFSTHAMADNLISVIKDESLSDYQKRLLSENVKWLASKRNKKQYGDKIEIDQNYSIDLKSAILNARTRTLGQNVNHTSQNLSTEKRQLPQTIDITGKSGNSPTPRVKDITSVAHDDFDALFDEEN